MSCPPANPSVTVPSRLARPPPDTVTSQACSEAVTSSTAVTVAVVPLTAKSAASTFATASLNVTRQVRLSAFVGDVAGSWRAIDVTAGAVVSRVLLSTARSVKSAAALPARSSSVLSVPEVGFA